MADPTAEFELLATRDEATLLARLRDVTLLKQSIRPYAGADIRLVTVGPDLLFPASRYVVRGHVQRQADLRFRLLAHGVDTLALSGAAEFRWGDEVWTVIPPVVEFSRERVQFLPRREGDLSHPPVDVEVPLINDGLHRVWLARSLGLPVRVVLIRGAAEAHPYYAYPGGWSSVREVDEVPADKASRKLHRAADHYALYRDFGPLGVGKPRHPSEIRHQVRQEGTGSRQ